MACAYFSCDLSNGRYDTSKPSSLHFCEVASTDFKSSAVTTSFGRTMALWSQENFILAEVGYRINRTFITARTFVGGAVLDITTAIRRRHRALGIFSTESKAVSSVTEYEYENPCIFVLTLWSACRNWGFWPLCPFDKHLSISKRMMVKSETSTAKACS